MAKTKSPKKKPAKKTATKRRKAASADIALSPAQRTKVLKKLKKLSIPPSHPSDITGPALELDYEAPLPGTKKSSRSGK
jgi:hypothetical protein